MAIFHCGYYIRQEHLRPIIPTDCPFGVPRNLYADLIRWWLHLPGDIRAATPVPNTWIAVGTDFETCFIFIPTRFDVECSSRDGPPETEEDKKKKQSFLKAIGEAFDEKYMFYFNRRADGYDPRPAPSPASALCERLPNQPDEESDDESDEEESDEESDEESNRIQPIAEIA